MAGNAAELRLQVTLDRQFFRGQLASLGQIASGYRIPIAVSIDRRSVQSELNKLGDNIRRRNYRLTVETNLSAEIAKAETLANKLAALAGKLKVSGGGGFAQSAQGAAGLMEYMRTQGLSGGGGFVGAGRSARFQKALEDLTVKQLQGLARQEGITFSGLRKSALIDKLLKDVSQTAMENILGNVEMALRRPVRGIFPSGRAVSQGPLSTFGMGGRAQQFPVSPMMTGGVGAGGGSFVPMQGGARAANQASSALTGLIQRMRALGDFIAGEDPATLARDAQRYAVMQGAAGRSQYAFPTHRMIYPSSPLGRITPQSSMFAQMGTPMGPVPNLPSPGAGAFGRALAGVSIPGAAQIRELGNEFAQATKQVLLYGTAYKALAFMTSLPGQAFNAAKGMETFRNQLDAVTKTSNQFGPSLRFIEQTIGELNVPIDSARNGFVRLFASLQPANFDPSTIQDLFSGITKASATFGLSADQVDRVFYAFGQMASKGQVMSEELKGQLGDVLPGSLALFAEAAQMSMTDFTAALEDGVFKGDAMRVLLENVAVLMNTKFSDAATKASQTLQGQLNAMQNSLQLMYEAMQPIVNRFAAAFGPAINALVKDATDVIKAFNLGISTTGDYFSQMSPRAQAFYSALTNILPTLRGLATSLGSAATNAGYFTSTLLTLLQPLLGVGKAALDFASIPFVARMGAYAAVVGVLTQAFVLLRNTGIIQATVAMVRFIATMSVAQIRVYIAGIQTLVMVFASMATSVNVARVAVTALKVSLVSLGVGAVMLALDAVISKLFSIGNAADNAKIRAAALTDELLRAAEAGDTATASARLVEAETQVQSITQAENILRRMQGGNMRLTRAEYQKLQQTGLAAGINFGAPQATTPGQIAANLEAARQGKVAALNVAGQSQEALQDAAQVALNRQRQMDQARQAGLKPLPAGAGEEGTAGGKKLEKYYSDRTKQLQDDLAIQLNQLEVQRKQGALSETQYAIQRATAEFATERALIDERYRLATAKGNDDNLSALDRQRQQSDLLLEKNKAIAKAQSDYGKALTLANIELKKPYEDLIRDEKLLAKEQSLRLDNYRDGLLELTPAQQAQLAIDEKTKELSEDQRTILQETLGIYEDLIRKRLENAQIAEREKELATVRQQIDVTEAGLGAGFLGEAATAYEQTLLKPGATKEDAMKMAKLTEQLSLLKMQADSTRQSIEGIGSAFATTMFDGTIALAEGSKTTKEVFADLVKSLAQMLMNAAKQMIATYIAIGIARMFAGMGASSAGSKAAPKVDIPAYGTPTLGGAPMYANGGIAPGGFKAFAAGGIVTGPTLGLVGEGRYNEAIIPMPNGKAVPVDLQGSAGGSTNVVINVDAKGTQAQGNDANANSLGRILAGAVQEEIMRQKRPGGLLA